MFHLNRQDLLAFSMDWFKEGMASISGSEGFLAGTWKAWKRPCYRSLKLGLGNSFADGINNYRHSRARRRAGALAMAAALFGAATAAGAATQGGGRRSTRAMAPTERWSLLS